MAAVPACSGVEPVGTATVDSAELRLPARHVLELDRGRMLPTGRLLPVQGSEVDFCAPRVIGSTVLDDCVTDVERDAEGLGRISLRDPSAARGLDVWMDERFRYVQLFSGETLAPERQRRGLAIEPMTCPPNAFRTGTDVLVLEPGAERSMTWGVRLVPAQHERDARGVRLTNG